MKESESVWFFLCKNVSKFFVIFKNFLKIFEKKRILEKNISKTMRAFWINCLVFIGLLDIYHGLPSNQQEHDLLLLDALSRRNSEGYYGGNSGDPVMDMLGRSKD